MNLQSMTGFARAVAEHEGTSIAWEVKSVNGKSVEVRLRLPQGFERLEPAVRQILQKRFARGNFQATLTIGRAVGAQAQPVVNEAFLKDLGLLSLRGVLDIPETVETEEARAALDAAIMAALEVALNGLEQARQGEGAALALLLSGHIDTIEALTLRAEVDPSRETAVIRERIAEQVRLLMDASANLDATRLHMEAAFLATKADIREEIDRLKTHVASGRALLVGGGAVGRKLDFLAQEFNRESNTLCSKSNAAAITAIGLDLKAVVDQFREQIQNLE
ncbi:MAG: YicC family protein [Mesorhizobium sp.]|uniref:YicC family protein n=1 Tax=Mesorhizobium sp. TaxID=1871066 RepID=UPI000FE63328|nr:YicC family protein [Mesorhizobium sp.]RWP85886.1 MAG: YicC family protein [Mesorhizobium sp.]